MDIFAAFVLIILVLGSIAFLLRGEKILKFFGMKEEQYEYNPFTDQWNKKD